MNFTFNRDFDIYDLLIGRILIHIQTLTADELSDILETILWQNNKN